MRYLVHYRLPNFASRGDHVMTAQAGEAAKREESGVGRIKNDVRVVL